MAKDTAATKKDDDAVVIKPDLERYKSGQSASGKRTQHTGDDVANTLNAMTLQETAEAGAAILGTDAKALIDQYATTKSGKPMNQGMKRMNIGNRIRAAVARLEKDERGAGTAALTKASAKQVKARDSRISKLAEEAKKAAAAKKEAAKKAAAKPKAAKKVAKKVAKKATKKAA